MKIKKGDLVAISYTGKFENGDVFDSSVHDGHEHPLEFRAGEGQVVPGFDKAIMGMEKNEEKEFTLKPEEAYGRHKEELQQKIPRSQLPKEKEPEAGMTIIASTPDGRQFPVKITAVDKETVTLDLNHPLAGKTLVFKIKIIDINHKVGKYNHK